MKKITFVIAFLLTIVTQSHAQFTESFEAAALPASWTVLNGGDANTWLAIDLSASTTISGHTGTHVAGIVYTTPTAHDDYLITPAITVTSGVNDRFSFWARSRDPLYPEVIDLKLSTTTPTAAAFTTVLQAGIAPLGGVTFYKYTYDLSAYVGQTVYIGFYSSTADQFIFDLDDVVSDALPFCSEPNPSAAGITETAADISWPAVPGSVNYEYVLDETAGDPAGAGTSTTDLTYSASSLTPGTTYYFHIRNNCDAAGLSAWSTISFTTETPFTGCLNSDTFGQWPATAFTPATCDGITSNVIVTNAYAGEYSVVNVTSGQTYTFTSSVATDLITISTDNGATGAAYGPTPLTWVATLTGPVRFYTHLDACGEEAVNRTRAVKCGIPACTMPTVTFATVSNCPAETFNVTANITNLGSATSITVTDNQSSASQTVTATGVVTFGPYASGLSVTLTVTNDQSATCTMTSAAQTQAACPPANDECIGAIALVPSNTFANAATLATSLGATNTDGLVASCQASIASNVWYTVQVPASGSISIETGNVAGSPYTDSVLIAYSGSCGSLTPIECDDDDSADGLFSILNLTGRTPGETLYISVWRFSLGAGMDGQFNIAAYDASLAKSTFDSANFRAYPNPVKNILNLSYDKTISNVAVFNLMGQEVITKSINSNLSQIDMSNLATGTYMVKVTADNQEKTIKVVKE